jgi:ABC-2 type transport system permease protein
MFKRIWAVTQKEFIQLTRNPLLLVGLMVAPALELWLFAAAIHTDVQHIPMVVADQSLSAASRSYLDAFTISDAFTIVANVASQADVVSTIDRGQASLGIVIPPDFAARVQTHDASVLLLVDGSDSFVTQSAATSAATISQQYALSLARRAGQPPLTPHIQILYNPDLQQIWFLVPGFGAFLLYGIALKLTAFAIVREREVGTIEALLVTPVRPIELMIAKMIPTLGVAIMELVTTFTLGITLFHVPFRGSLVLFSALAALFAAASLGLGLAISSISQSQVQANQVATLMNIAVMFLSGFLFPAYSLPWLLRVIGYIMPMTFFMPITIGIITKGAGLADLWPQALALAGLTVAIFVVGAQFFKQKLD